MYYHKIRADSLPEPVFACSLTAENYVWKNGLEEGCVEIGLMEGKEILMTVNGETEAFSGCVLSITVGGENVSALAGESEKIFLNTVAVRFKNMEWSMCELPQADPEDGGYFLFPCLWDASEEKVKLTRLIKTYISHYARSSAYDRAMCVSVWFELAAHIDKISRASLRPKPFSTSEYYVKKVDSIIALHYRRGIRVAELAKELGVTPNYLCSVYNRGSGRTITEAVSQTRMQKARELAFDRSLKVCEIAEYIGLRDEGYLRRQFKRCWGVGINECRRIDHEVTLYHQKPWENK